MSESRKRAAPLWPREEWPPGESRVGPLGRAWSGRGPREGIFVCSVALRSTPMRYLGYVGGSSERHRLRMPIALLLGTGRERAFAAGC